MKHKFRESDWWIEPDGHNGWTYYKQGKEKIRKLKAGREEHYRPQLMQAWHPTLAQTLKWLRRAVLAEQEDLSQIAYWHDRFTQWEADLLDLYDERTKE